MLFTLFVFLHFPLQYAKDIETESKSQNKFLDEIQDSFDNASNLLSNTLHRVLGIPKKRTNNRKFMCYVILFVVIFILLVYLFVFHRYS
uniref:SNARE complex protein, putative n=1 Tax=Schistosoma mansoni TaxID=6183 RepID=A0A3Q0KB98_SCHMA